MNKSPVGQMIRDHINSKRLEPINFPEPKKTKDSVDIDDLMLPEFVANELRDFPKPEIFSQMILFDWQIDDAILYPRIEILRLLPHGDEFCHLDGITHLDHANWEAGGFRRVKPSMFTGHFKKTLLFPKVFKEEAIAQLGAFLLRSNEDFENYIPIFDGYYFGRDLGIVLPGDKLDLKIRMINFDGRRSGTVYGQAFVHEKMVHILTFDFNIMPDKVFQRIISKQIAERKRGE